MTLAAEARAAAKPHRRFRPEKAARPAWEGRPPVVLTVFKWAVLISACLAILIPMWMVVVTSLASDGEITDAGGMILFPKDFSLTAYRQIFSGGAVIRAMMVSIAITAVGTAVSTVVTILAAYGLSRPTSLWHRPMLMTILLTYLFAPGMIPVYLVVQNLRLLDAYAALILPGLVWAFNLVVLRAFFMEIPRELIDSARLDGASEWRTLRQIVLPLSKAPIAVVALFYGVGYWNNFFNALLYINTTEKWPLQLVLRTFVLQGQSITSSGADPMVNYNAPELAVQMAVVVVAMLPVLVVYPFVQRHFTKGVIVGAVKG